MASSLDVPMPTPTKNPIMAVRAERKLKRRAMYQDMPVESRMK